MDAKSVHGDRYTYDNLLYINDSTSVVITCKHHGDFQQIANKHINGRGCPQCRLTRIKITKREKNSKMFPIRSMLVHNNKYNYSLSNYINGSIPVEIICPTHGSFFQKPSAHLSGSGCKFCSESKGEKIIERYLKENNIVYERQKKFEGCFNKNLLSFDFWLPVLNILIEFDGSQHFKPSWSFGKHKLEYTQICDNIKNDFCASINTKLVRISYLEINNIYLLLDNYLSQ